jgi:hypothetical protein
MPHNILLLIFLVFFFFVVLAFIISPPFHWLQLRTIFDVGHGDIDRQRPVRTALRDSSQHGQYVRQRNQAASQFARHGTHDSRTWNSAPASHFSPSATFVGHQRGRSGDGGFSVLLARSIHRHCRTRRANLERNSRKESFFQLLTSFT